MNIPFIISIIISISIPLFYLLVIRPWMYKEYSFGNNCISNIIRNRWNKKKRKDFNKYIWSKLSNDKKEIYSSNELLEKIEKIIIQHQEALPSVFKHICLFYLPYESGCKKGQGTAKNGNALIKNVIIIKGDWTDLVFNNVGYTRSLNPELLMLIGHEIGHKDFEPLRFPFLPFQNHIREVRADKCGLLLSIHMGIDEGTAIEAKFPNPEINEKDHFTHPSNYHRKEMIAGSIYDAIETIATRNKIKSRCIIEYYKRQSMKGNIFNNTWK